MISHFYPYLLQNFPWYLSISIYSRYIYIQNKNKKTLLVFWYYDMVFLKLLGSKSTSPFVNTCWIILFSSQYLVQILKLFGISCYNTILGGIQRSVVFFLNQCTLKHPGIWFSMSICFIIILLKYRIQYFFQLTFNGLQPFLTYITVLFFHPIIIKSGDWTYKTSSSDFNLFSLISWYYLFIT